MSGQKGRGFARLRNVAETVGEHESARMAAFEAAKANAVDELKSFLASGAPAGVDERNRSLLGVAALHAHLDCVSVLLSDDAAQFVDSQGQTPLMLAASNASPDCVKLLLPVSDAKKVDKNGVTALMLAAMAGRPDCMRALLPKSDPLATDSHGRNAFDYAAGCAYLLDGDEATDGSPEFECVEILSNHASIAQKEFAIERLGEERLPCVCASLETDVLRREVHHEGLTDHKRFRGARTH